MYPQDVIHPRLETRLNLISRQILLRVGERGEIDVNALGAELNVPGELAHVAVGWLTRSRVVDLIEDPAGRLRLKMRTPFE